MTRHRRPAHPLYLFGAVIVGAVIVGVVIVTISLASSCDAPSSRRNDSGTGADAPVGPADACTSCRTDCGASCSPADCGASCNPVTGVPSDPVTTALTGSHATYNVGPGQTYAEPDKVPWGTLTAGDVVNIYHRATAYKWKLGLRGKGTASAPIVINGVTSSTGQRPKLDFNGARTASGSNPGGGNDVFKLGSEWSLEEYAGIMVKAGASDPYGYKPAFIQIKNLELTGAGVGTSFVSLSGATIKYLPEAAAIWLQPGTDVLIENNVIYNNGFGIFTMAKNSTLEEAFERVTVRRCRIYANGVVGSYNEHNLYIQSTNPIIEGNYFGVLRPGAEGSTYKSRSSGEIFRYNYVEASARAIDWVYAEDQSPGIATRPDYGTDYAYGNIIVNDCSAGNCASSPIHYGGDNLDEQDDTTTLLTPSEPYRSHLYFYNNTVVNRMSRSKEWRTNVFDLSLRGTTVDAWNNIFYFEGDSNFSWVEHAGKLQLRGTNLAYGATVANATDTALAINYSVSKLGTLLTGNPKVSATDLRPGAGSAAIDAATGVPAGISPASSYLQVPPVMEPGQKINGLYPRKQTGTAIDLGALEAK